MRSITKRSFGTGLVLVAGLFLALTSNVVTQAQEAAAQKAEAGKAPAAPFDVGKFAGIFAAIGLAVGAIGTAIASVVTGFLGLKAW